MTRLLAVLALLALSGCASEPVQCGACLGSAYRLGGLPAGLRPEAVVTCVAHLPCTRAEDLDHFRPEDSQRLDLPDGTTVDQDLEGETIRVTVQAGERVWSGRSTLRWHSSQGPCDCDALRSDIELSRDGVGMTAQ